MTKKSVDGGFFISFEGGEGSGKTTQINLLAQSLSKQDFFVKTTREPGGTPEAETIRDLLVQRGGGNWTPLSEVLLLFAARELHVKNVIKPLLADGGVVITDRFTDSTRAYQGYGYGLGVEKIDAVNDLVLDGFEPDVTFILNIDARQGLERSNRRLAAEALSIKQSEDRYEQLDIEFHEKLAAGFLDIAAHNPQRCVVIDATQTVDEMAAQILQETMTRLAGC